MLVLCSALVAARVCLCAVTSWLRVLLDGGLAGSFGGGGGGGASSEVGASSDFGAEYE